VIRAVRRLVWWVRTWRARRANLDPYADLGIVHTEARLRAAAQAGRSVSARLTPWIVRK
jgi:hypothetical protein